MKRLWQNNVNTKNLGRERQWLSSKNFQGTVEGILVDAQINGGLGCGPHEFHGLA